MRIMQIRSRNINFDANGTDYLKYVMARRFIKNGYTHVKFAGITYSTSIVSGIVWIDKPICL